MSNKISIWVRRTLYEVCTKCVWLDSRPVWMLQRDRPVELLEPDEFVFVRWFGDHFDDNQTIKPNQIVLPDQSFNRAYRQGRPWTVLLPDPELLEDKDRVVRQLSMGVLRFLVSEHSFEWVAKSGKKFTFEIVHDPLQHNFLHCELRCLKDGVRFSRDDSKKWKSDERTEWQEAALRFRILVANRYQETRKNRVRLRALVATKGQAIVPH